MTAELPIVRLRSLAGRQRESWRALIELAPNLGAHWLLIGGQMVFLHEVERGVSDMRPTDDVDVVVDVRIEPAGLGVVDVLLREAGFEQSMPSADGVAHRYRRDGATIDVLAPDNLGKRASLALGSGRTIEAPGGTQALSRSGTVMVQLDNDSAMIRRPTLVGALLGKAAAATQIVSQTTSERAKHERDVDSLARVIGPTDRESAALTKKERSLLTSIAASPGLSELARRSIMLLAEWSA